jgi:hypothetical protein
VRSFAEELEQAIEASAAEFKETPSFERPVVDDAIVSMIATASAIEVVAPAWAMTIGVHFPCTEIELKRSFRQRAFETHPDRPGGSHEAFLDVSRALEEGVRAIASSPRDMSVANAVSRAYGRV